LSTKKPGADIVHAALAGALIPAVNYSEVLKKCFERGVPTEPLISLTRAAYLEIVPFDELLAKAGAELYLQTKQHGLSFADRACLALGIQRDRKVLTSERRMGKVILPLKVKLIRNAH
jgi:ribonuclease VapC